MKRGVLVIALLLGLFILLDGCRKEVHEVPISQEEPVEETMKPFYLYWDAYSPEERREDFETGFLWGLSFLGAELPASTAHEIFEWQGNRMTFHYEKAGFSEQAQEVLESFIRYIQGRREYQHRGGMDAGRFLMLTLNSSWHYYKLVEMPNRQKAFQANYNFREKEAGIVESAVSHKSRLIQMTSVMENSHAMAFVSKEISDTANPNSILEFEVMDVMKNGQLRFGIYGVSGILITAADPVFSAAGKPAKCLWCHELNVMEPFSAVTHYRDYLSPDDFREEVDSFQTALDRYRAGLETAIDYSNKQDHTFMELLYLSFEEPSAYRLAQEWGMTEQEVKNKLAGLTSHKHGEFPQLGDVYSRKDVDPLAPFPATPVPESSREFSAYEPNWPVDEP
ncbi:hypothetical protein KFE98_04480 [bacterium SCSIO 12741]|nr:hypothetical protein KFE98_04480 [bacterium SCSIO 12741]